MSKSIIETRRIVMIPLHEEYTIIQERVSNLETFMQCPFKYMAEPEFYVKNDGTAVGVATSHYYVYGHLMHTMIQEFCKYEDKLKALQDLLLLYPEYAHVIEPYFEAIVPLGLHCLASNVKVFCEIEAGPYLLCLTGEIDMIVKDGDKRCIIDLKFPQSERDEGKHDMLWQRFLYPFLFGEQRGYDDLSYFEYIILTKHQKGGIPRPRMQQFRTKIEKEVIREKSFQVIKSFLIARHKKEYEEKPSKICYTCKLKALGQCMKRI